MQKKKKAYVHAQKPVSIPVPGNKTIDEYIGLMNSQTDSISVARMEAPPKWGEPEQTPEFDEVTIMLEGKMVVEMDGKSITIKAGETFLAKAENSVRYSNPFDEKAVYWAVCTPAFSPERVNRNEE